MSNKSITKKTSNFLVWMILLLVLLGLGGYGVTNFGGSIKSIGSVGDTEISIRDYQRALTQELRAYEAQIGHPVTLAEATANAGLDAAVRQRLITAAALDNETARLGISVSDEKVRSEVLDIPSFRGPDGKFDRETYRLALEQAHLKEPEYERIVRRETARTLVQGAVLGGVKVPAPIRESFLNYAGERRDFSWVRLGQKDLTAPVPEATDQDLKTYYQSHIPDFTLPKMKRISYVWITPDMIQDKIKVDEAKLKEIYQSRLSEFSTPERRLVERLVYPDAESAAAAKAKLDAGEARFEDLVKARNLTLKDIDLGDITKDALSKEAADAVFSMTAPGVVGPLPSALGPALFRMNAILPAQETSYAEARPQLLAEYQLEQARRQISAMIPDIEDLLAGGATLEDVAKETDLQVGSIDWWDGLGEGIANYDTFRAKALKAAKGDFPEVVTLEDGGLFALQLDKMLEPRVQPIEKVMPKVIAGWENQRLEDALHILAEQLAPQFKAGRDLSSLGLTVTKEVGITRGDFIDGTPKGFLKKVFQMDKGAVEIVPGYGAVLMVRLDDIQPPATDDPKLAQLGQAIDGQLRQSMARDVFAAYVGSLVSSYGLTLNQAAINAVHAQFP